MNASHTSDHGKLVTTLHLSQTGKSTALNFQNFPISFYHISDYILDYGGCSDLLQSLNLFQGRKIGGGSRV